MHPLIKLLRPHQWIKNGFVFVGLLFGHAWHDPATVMMALAAFAAFCLLASAVYVMNDLADREHQKRIVAQFERLPQSSRARPW